MKTLQLVFDSSDVQAKWEVKHSSSSLLSQWIYITRRCQKLPSLEDDLLQLPAEEASEGVLWGLLFSVGYSQYSSSCVHIPLCVWLERERGGEGGRGM